MIGGGFGLLPVIHMTQLDEVPPVVMELYCAVAFCATDAGSINYFSMHLHLSLCSRFHFLSLCLSVSLSVFLFTLCFLFSVSLCLIACMLCPFHHRVLPNS
jgi:hypothetical protein